MSNQSLYAMYVIGAVESNHNWAAINASDPITLGMMQWYGNRAYGLLNRGRTADPTGWNTFKASDSTLAAHGEANDISWPNYFVTGVDVSAWQTWAKSDDNHKFQQAQWEDDYTAYAKVCDNIGIPAANIQVRILWMTAYHQSPQRAYAVINSVGVMCTLDRLHTGLLADSVLGIYTNRYNTAYNMLTGWDGTSAPPDFGQVAENTSPTNGNTQPTTTGTSDKPVLIQQFGDNLKLTVGDDKYTVYKSAAQTWQAKTIAGKKIDPGNTGGGDSSGSTSTDATKVLAWIAARAGKFAYSQGAGRLNPDSSGYTDCSGLIWAAYHFAIGKTIGTWTGAEAGHGTRVCISSNTSIANGIAMAQPGDILLITWSGHNPSYDHEEIFQADTSQVWSHGGPGNGPTSKSASEQMGYASEWEIRREL